MDAYQIDNLIEACRRSGQRYLEFVRTPTMSAGLFRLPAGAIDDHEPHSRDELYHVVQGRGVLRVRDEDREVSPGSVVFVAAGVQHHFRSITEELAILVFFLILLVRMVLDWVQVFARTWRPTGVALVVAEATYTVTDPPLRLLRHRAPFFRRSPPRVWPGPARSPSGFRRLRASANASAVRTARRPDPTPSPSSCA